jgi:addiction module HigA family antidote
MRARKRPPVHPGRILKEHYLVPLDLTIVDLADRLGITRKTLSAIINGRASVTTETALRLSRAFDTTPDLWLNLQQAYDLFQSAKAKSDWKKVKRIPFELCEGNACA